MRVSLGLCRIFICLKGAVVGIVVGADTLHFGIYWILLNGNLVAEKRSVCLLSERVHTALQAEVHSRRMSSLLTVILPWRKSGRMVASGATRDLAFKAGKILVTIFSSVSALQKIAVYSWLLLDGFVYFN